ncbi:MAG: FAD-dependent oxidoreductase, partial [Thermoanaerobaculia bacterium]|nr:FAD-dependent oxidoreductase [Thermoanaerobaculia bacterium]
VDGFEVGAGRVDAVATSEGRIPCASVAIAGGAWSTASAEALGARLPVAPQRGQIVHLQWHDASPGDWPMVAGLRDHYLVPWRDGRVVAGATRETGSGFAPETTAAGLREVFDQALDLAPGLAAATFVEVRVGLRPLSADGAPILGRLPGFENVWVATGHGPAGLMLGPYSGRVVAAAIAASDDTAIPPRLRPERFASALPADADGR